MIAYLITGSNIGDRNLHLQNAIEQINLYCGKILRTSAIYETAAWGNENQDSFYNQVLEIETEMQPEALLSKILAIEKDLGRIRNKKYDPRIIDIDILFIDDLIIYNENLKVPHPHIAKRKFVLTPLNELIPEFVHPVLQKKIAVLLRECSDALNVQKI